MINAYNVWCKWHPLKKVALGSCYDPDFFKDISSDKLRSGLSQILEETSQDLAYFESVLKQFGCEVIRPNIDKNDSVFNYINESGKILSGIPSPPMVPRDRQLVIGNKLYLTSCNDDRFNEICSLVSPKDVIDLTVIPDDFKKYPYMTEKEFNKLAGPSWLSYEDYIKPGYFENLPKDILDEITAYHTIDWFVTYAPSITVVGRDIYVDNRNSMRLLDWHKQSIIDNSNADVRFNEVYIGGHNDGVFHTVKPGAIISIKDAQRYEETFPGWDICYLEHQGWDAVDDFVRIKEATQGKWWVPGHEDNHELTYFVETWLQDWVGYCEETVFDVNVLMLDDRHVCVNNYNETAFAFFKKHRIEPIIVPWRHRFFWDGGLHCITLDLYRQGNMEDYFPDRTSHVVDLGFD